MPKPVPKRWLVRLCAIAVVLIVSLWIGKVLLRVLTVQRATISLNSKSLSASLESNVGYSNEGLVRVTSIKVIGDNQEEKIFQVHGEPIQTFGSFVWNPIQKKRYGFGSVVGTEFLLTFPLSPDLNGVLDSRDPTGMTLISVVGDETFESILNRSN